MKEIIAGNLTRYRQGLGLYQEALAEKVAVTCHNIKNYENAKSLPDSKTLSAIARVLGITLNDLLHPESRGLPNFRFRAYTCFEQKPQSDRA